MRVPATIIFVSALLAVCHAQKFRFTPVKQTVLQQRMQPAPADWQERKARIRQLFIQAGCTRDELSEQTLKNVTGANVICRLPGKSKDTIVIGANYSQAAFDNWLTASLLPSVFESLIGRKRQHTFIFIAFADGSRDVAGSEFFAEEMSQSGLSHIQAMINLEALGFSPTKISTSASDKKLVKAFMTVTYVLKQMASQVDLAPAIHLDSEPFASRKIPQITIHSLTKDAVEELQVHDEQLVSTTSPDFAHVEPGFRVSAYYSSYHLISGYLAYLDVTLKSK